MGEVEDLFDVAEALYQQRIQQQVQLPEQPLEIIPVLEDLPSPINVIASITVEGTIPSNELINAVTKLPNSITNLATIADVESALNDIYGDSWDYFPAALVYDRSTDTSFKYYAIKFVDITISNTEGREHNIKDLYVVFGIRLGSNKLYFESKIYGIRTTVTAKERKSFYRHSHLMANSSDTYSKNATAFCVGSNSTISILIAELSLGVTVDKFELFLYQLQTFVRHESIEGGPYIRMENIGKAGNNSTDIISVDVCRKHLNDFLELYRDSLCVLHIPVLKTQGKYKINGHSKVFVDLIKPICTKWCIKTLQGSYMKVDQQLDTYTNTQQLFVFKSEPVIYTVISEELEEVVELYPHPGIIGYIEGAITKEMDNLLILKKKHEHS